MSASLEQVAGWISEASTVVCLTGAGISTDSGIPDFRGPNGLWTTDPEKEKLSNIHYYVGDKQIREKAWRARLEHPAFRAAPNAGHRALARLEAKGKLQTLITQNIDGLHQAAGNSAGIVIEMHGTLHEVACLQCAERTPMQTSLSRVETGETDPACLSCGGILKSATVSFGQSLAPADVEKAVEAAEKADVFICAGTSLGVYPVAELPAIAIRAGARLVIFNQEETPYDPAAEASFDSHLSELLPRLVSMVQ